MSKSHISRVRELYKLILRLHRSLPEELKILGDNYAREEFKRHKKCKPQEAQIFLSEWREYAATMSRQATPTRAGRRAADAQRARPQRQVRAADLEGATARDWEDRGPAVASSTRDNQPDYGINLDPDLISRMNPDQLINLYHLLTTLRGEKSNEFANEPIDIELLGCDASLKRSEDAKKRILEMLEEDKKLRHGERDNNSFNKEFWIKLFNNAQTIKDVEQLEFAVTSTKIAEEEAKNARDAAEIAIEEYQRAKKIADNAYAAVQNAKKEAEQAREANSDPIYQKTIQKSVEKAEKEENYTKKIADDALKLATIAKSKAEEADAALEYAKEAWKNVNVELRKLIKNNP